jgi:thiamine biosynthesis protein ThiS
VLCEILLNGEKRTIPENLNLEGMVQFLGLTPERLAIELNFQVVKKEKWSEKYLSNGDRVEIVHFVGGGSQMRLTCVRSSSRPNNRPV